MLFHVAKRSGLCGLPQLLACLALASLAACQSNPYLWTSQVGKEIDTTLEKAEKGDAKPGAVPSDVSQALLPSLGTRVPEGRGTPLETRFDLAVSNAPARQVFLSLVEGTPYSMVLHPDIGGLVSMQLKAVTVPEALEAIRRVYGYEYRREANRYFILGSGIQTRIFPVNYLNLNRKGKSDTRVSSGIQSSGAGGAAAPAGGGASRGGASGIQVETDSKADFWKELQDALVAIVGTESGRKVIVNPQANLIIVRAMPEDMRVVEDFLGVTHATVNRQVILEAKILEVRLNDGYQTGINWAALGANTTFGQTGGGTIFGDTKLSDIAGNTGVLNPTTPPFSAVSNTNTSAFGGVFSAAVKTANFAAFLEFLKTQGDVQVLSSPRVSTVNNQKAVIKVGTDEFFITSTTSTPSGVIGVPASVTTEIAPFFSGIALDVTPQIDDSGNIVLHIHPAVSDAQQKTINFTLQGQANTLQTALSSIQESDNIVRALSGQVVVIGGLMKQASTDDNASIPFLGDIPIVGNAFKHKRVTRIKSELVILLKPTIMDLGSNQPWTDSIQDSRERIRGLNR
ncbi:MAG TPA: pilus (MSHA type) biogenesis protein MshL [Acidiferrobacterales bacterium]|nr:pilus (MSHA type) biogenesis protein MshL [Acidiferrobacterales bacterium]